jgi:hypothetical protein
VGSNPTPSATRSADFEFADLSFFWFFAILGNKPFNVHIISGNKLFNVPAHID